MATALEMVTRPRLPSKGQQWQLPSEGQALRWHPAVRPLDGNRNLWPFVSIRMLLEIHHFIDEFSLHLYIHKQQLTKSTSHTTELVNQVPKWLYLFKAIAEDSIPLKCRRNSPSSPSPCFVRDNKLVCSHWKGEILQLLIRIFLWL